MESSVLGLAQLGLATLGVLGATVHNGHLRIIKHLLPGLRADVF